LSSAERSFARFAARALPFPIMDDDVALSDLALAEHVAFGQNAFDGSIGSGVLFCISTSCQGPLIFSIPHHGVLPLSPSPGVSEQSIHQPETLEEYPSIERLLYCRRKHMDNFDHDKVDEIVLALLQLTLHDYCRAWKGV
jgi:hypothetical protein